MATASQTSWSGSGSFGEADGIFVQGPGVALSSPGKVCEFRGGGTESILLYVVEAVQFPIGQSSEVSGSYRFQLHMLTIERMDSLSDFDN